MIEINLLPGGARKKASATKSSIDFAAMAAGINARMGDKLLIACVAGVLIAVGLGGWLYYKQGHDRTVAEARLDKALTDSTRYAKVVAERLVAQAKRDTLMRQVNLIHAIDDDRYIWPHIMDEVSRVLPPYTWITILTYGGVPAGSTNVVAAPPPPKPIPGDTSKKKKPAVLVQTAIKKDDIVVRLTGRTVDIQALTRFMKDLEDSPFFSNVYMERTTPGTDQGKELYQFQLTINYSRPDSTAVRRIPFVATAR